MSGWQWVTATAVYAIHERQLDEHGGLDGVRDENSVESALARPQNLAAYESPDAAALAACYAVGIARNHGFADGNKRTAWAAAWTFLYINGFELGEFDVDDAEIFMNTVATDGAITVEYIAAKLEPYAHSP